MADDIRLVIGVDDRDLIRTQKEQKKFERNILIIEAAFRKGDITAKRYAGELNRQAKQMSRLGGTYNKANSEVRTYAASVRKLTADQLRMTQATNMAGKSTNRFGMYAQQVGYQVGDFFVQVQSGTSALVAFGQQGTQLAGLLPGVAGAVVGISLAVGTMLLRSFMDVNDATNVASQRLKTYEANLESAREKVQELRNEIQFLASGFNSVDEMTFSEQIDKSVEKLRLAKEALEEATTGAALIGQGAAGGIDLASLFGFSAEDKVEDAKKLVAQSTLELAALREMQRQEELRIRNQSVINGLSKARGILTQKELKAKEDLAEIEKKLVVSQEAKFSSQKQTLDLSLMQANLEQQYEDKLYIQNLIARQKIQLQVESQQITKEQGKELMLLTDNLTDQKMILEDIKQSEKDRLELIKQQDLFMKKNPLDPFGGKGRFIPNYVKDKEKKKKKVVDPYADLMKQLKLERALVGQTTARKRVLNALGVDQSKWSTSAIAKLEAEVVAVEKLQKAEEERIRIIEEAKRAQEELAATIETSMGDAFMAMSDGTKSVSDAFRTMAAEVVRELYKVYVMQVAIAAIKTFAGGFFADGGAFSGGKEVTAYANGGVVNGPTNFAMAGGKTGLMGEAGPEAIMPLKRGANGKLGVQMEGGGGSTHVTNNYNISANTSEDTKRLVTQTIQQAQPALTQAAKASMMNDRRRGGQMKSVFG
jgi:hypothetical protein|tara:strand:+ start:3382 stop:5502 length:2121 start_codon:yes stop_codon:yes gene_type:complete